MYRGVRLRPDDAGDPFAFRMDLSEMGLGSIRVVFGQDAEGTTTKVHLDVMPLTLTKRPATRNPRWWAACALGAVSVITAASVARRRRRRA